MYRIAVALPKRESGFFIIPPSPLLERGVWGDLREAIKRSVMNQRGITLLELITVMIIIAIGAVLTTPNIGGWLTSLRLRSASRDVASVMRVAQLKAVSNNTQYQVVFNPGNSTYVLKYRDTGGNWVDEGSTLTLPTGVNFVTTLVGDTATFSSNSTATGGNIVLTNTKGTQKTVNLLGLTGRIRIE